MFWWFVIVIIVRTPTRTTNKMSFFFFIIHWKPLLAAKNTFISAASRNNSRLSAMMTCTTTSNISVSTCSPVGFVTHALHRQYIIVYIVSTITRNYYNNLVETWFSNKLQGASAMPDVVINNGDGSYFPDHKPLPQPARCLVHDYAFPFPPTTRGFPSPSLTAFSISLRPPHWIFFVRPKQTNRSIYIYIL